MRDKICLVLEFRVEGFQGYCETLKAGALAANPKTFISLIIVSASRV